MSLGQALRQFFQPQSKKPASPPNPVPEEVVQSAQLGKPYAGGKIIWELNLITMSNEINREEILLLTRDGRTPYNIWFSVPAEPTSEIFQHGSGSRVRVTGVVKVIHAENIYLEECQLEFI